MNETKQTNTQEMLGSLRDMNRQLAHMNSQLRSIRHCCNFVVVAIMLCFLAVVWKLIEFYASIPIEQY